jgi:hypothetical protein
MKDKTNFTLEDFKKSVDKMIATSDSSYSGDTSFKRTPDLLTYSKEEAEQIIASGQPEELKDLSVSFFYSSGFYRRFILYYATFLKYTPVIIPHMSGNQKSITDTKYSKRYYESLEFFNKLNFEKLCQNFTLKVMVEGAYYGILRDYGADGVGIQDLPFDYCRTRFKTPDGIDIVELNLQYFDNIRDKVLRDQCLATFPPDVEKAYNAYKNRNESKWYMLEPGVGIHFCLYEERPFMLNVIPAIIDFDEYRELEKDKDKQELKKILVQEMPITSDGELVFDPEEVQEMHRGVVGMLKKNKDIDVLTSFGDVSLEDMQDARSVITNNLEKIEKTIYSEAGVSKQVFAADGNLSLEKSIQNDMALMMYLAGSYSIWLSYVLNQHFGDNKINFTAKILPVSYYNNDEYISKTLDMAQYGYSFLVPSVALGLNQSEITDIKRLEIELLKLDVELIPLQSSHTQSDGGSSNKDEESATGEKPNNEKDQDKKSDRTLENEQSKDGGGN